MSRKAEQNVLNVVDDANRGAESRSERSRGLGTIPPPPVELSLALQRAMLGLKGQFMSADGRGVDYQAMAASPAFLDEYRSLARRLVACELESLRGMSEEQRMAFFINIYNAVTIHGLIELAFSSPASSNSNDTSPQGLPRPPPPPTLVTLPEPSSVLELKQFWCSTCYNISGLVFSLDCIEHGVLRGNRPHPSASDPPFGPNDPRRELSMKKCDPRIHFALVCGAKSCPAIQVYSEKNLDSALTAAAKSFCEQEVELDTEKRKVTLSKIFQWYFRDFGESKRELLRESLVQMLEDESKEIHLCYRDYNWLLNKL